MLLHDAKNPRAVDVPSRDKHLDLQDVYLPIDLFVD